MKTCHLLTFLLPALLVPVEAGWLDIDSITTRDTSDITCQSNARTVASDSAGNVHVVWRGRVGGVWQVWYSHLDAGDTAWSTDETLAHTAGGVADPACVVGSDQSFYVGWNDISTGVLHLAKRDASGNWTTLDSLPGQNGDSMLSLAADDGGAIHAVWARGEWPNDFVCYASLDPGGWSRTDTVNTNPHATRPSVACNAGESLMVVWTGAADHTVQARTRALGGWRAEETVYASDVASDPCVASDGGGFHIAWLANYANSGRVMVRSKVGSGWADTIRVSRWRVGQPGASIAADADGELHVAWSGLDSLSQNYNHVQHVYRPAGGSWSQQQRLDSLDADRVRVSVSAQDGTVQVAWTELAPSVPAVRLRRYERVHDVGVMRIEQPRDTVDSGSVLRPVAWVKNYGEFPEANVPVTFRLAGYEDSAQVPNLASGDTVRVEFDSTVATIRGLAVAACSTGLNGDAMPDNDTARVRSFVRVKDAGVTAIVSPADSADSGVALAPQALVRNFGNTRVSFPVTLSIGTGYRDSALVTGLAPSDSELVSFNEWTPMRCTTYAMQCVANLAEDQVPVNDTLRGQVSVRRCDVGVSQVVTPVGLLDSGVVVAPECLVRNYGTQAQSYHVRLRIGTHVDTAFVANHEPDTILLVTFPVWTADSRGWFDVVCSTALAGDRNPDNDAKRESVFVRVLDGAAVQILCPVETLSRGSVVPRACVANRGNVVATARVFFSVEGSSGPYQADTVVRMEPGSDSVVSFGALELRSGPHTATCSVYVSGDSVRGNDVVRQAFYVARVNVAALGIPVPADTIFTGTVQPQASVANLGDEPASFRVWFRARGRSGSIHDDSGIVSGLGPMDSAVVTFGQWSADADTYILSASVGASGDEYGADDTASRGLAVVNWRGMAELPRGPRGRGVRAGGCLVPVRDRILALKGGSTREFYSYDPAQNAWSVPETIPAGPAGRGVRAGASTCWDGQGYVYALRGNNTREFWRYDLSGDTWQQLPGLPEQTTSVKHGAGLAFVPGDTDRVFLVKGSGTLDFLVFWTAQSQWHARRSLPEGPKSLPARHGTCLVAIGRRVYCAKGGTGQVYEYLADGDAWIEVAGLPAGNRWKRGSALTSDGAGVLYALKGGRTTQLWQHDTREGSWTVAGDVPGGVNCRKVKDGGALAYFAGRLYVLKGGGTREFWCYRIPEKQTCRPKRDGVAADEVGSPCGPVRATVVKVSAVFRMSVAAGVRGVRVVDTGGRVVGGCAVMDGVARMRFSQPGIYFLAPVGACSMAVRVVAVR